MEIIKHVDFDEKKVFELEMHSFLNVLSVVTGMVQVVQMETSKPELISGVLQRGFELARAIRNGDRTIFNTQNLLALKQHLLDGLRSVTEQDPNFGQSAGFSEMNQIFVDILKVLDVRVAELEMREQNPGKWERFTIEEFKADFRKFFYAMEQSSKGRYQIVYNVAQQHGKDYLVHFEIASDLNDHIMMPLLLKDVVRDLIANARKYTQPGGEITIGLAMLNRTMRFVVGDTGMGIPADEIEHVVDFGFRGSNVAGKVRTLGDGFGLTKAYYVTKQLSGRMWIDSEVGKGTRVTLEVPVPPAVYPDI